MKRSIPLTGTTTSTSISSPEHQRFLKSLNRAMEKTLASGKIKIRPHGERQSTPAEQKPEPAKVLVVSGPTEQGKQVDAS